MNTNRVFMGYDKDYNEHLLYKKDDYNYIDLISDKEYSNKEFNPELLIPFNVFKKNKNMFKRTIKKIYTNDRNEIFNLRGLYVGAIRKIFSCELNSIDVKANSKFISHTLVEKIGKGQYFDLINNNKIFDFDKLCRIKKYTTKKILNQIIVDVTQIPLAHTDEFRNLNIDSTKKEIIEEYQYQKVKSLSK